MERAQVDTRIGINLNPVVFSDTEADVGFERVFFAAKLHGSLDYEATQRLCDKTFGGDLNFGMVARRKRLTGGKLRESGGALRFEAGVTTEHAGGIDNQVERGIERLFWIVDECPAEALENE